MDGGLLQLIAKSAEDMPLINKPEITHFKKIYRKTDNFSIMDSEVILDDLKFEKTKLSKIPKVGDLINKVYLELNIPDFKVKKIETQNFTEEIFKDKNFVIKQSILKKFLEIENLEELKIDDNTLIKLSPNALAKNILLSKINQLDNNYILNFPIDNYKIISYLLTSNLKEEDIILSDFLLRYLEISKDKLLTSGEYLSSKFSLLYENLIKNYYYKITYQNKERYQLSNKILQELQDYLIENKKSNDLTVLSQYNSNPLNFIKNNFVYEAEILENLIKLIFPTDNFRKGNLSKQFILPFFVYLHYDVNNDNRIRYELTDTKLISSSFIKENINKITNKVKINTPILDIISNTFEKIKVESENYFKSVNYQKILGDNPKEILSILIAITEIWKWIGYNFTNKTEWQLIPSLEILNLTQAEGSSLTEYISKLSFFNDLDTSTMIEKNFQDNITLDFERKKTLDTVDESDYYNLIKVISLVKSKLKDVNIFDLGSLTLNSSYLNRSAIDLSLILVYISNLYKNKLLNNSFLKKDNSHSWVNFLNETICSKMYAKWFSECTSRIDESYVGPQTYLESNGESKIKLDDKIPLVIFPNNTYNLTSNAIKDLIKSQTYKFNYYLKIASTLNLANYDLKTIKKFKNLKYSLISENNKQFLVIESNIINVWYHNFTNKYILVTKNKNIPLIFYSIKNNKIYFEITNSTINIDLIEYLKVIITKTIRVRPNGVNITLNTITTNTTFTDNELLYYYFYKMFYDDTGKLIELLPIPKKMFVDNKISSTFTFDNEPEHSSSDIKYLNQLKLPNFIEKYDFTTDYLTFKKIEETSIGNDGVATTSLEDKFRSLSYIHQITFIQRTSGYLQLYHLPYKINSQIYNDINIECDNYINEELIEILGRFSNKFNLREKIDTNTLHIYSEGLDFFDTSIDYNKLDNSLYEEVNEDDHLSKLNIVLQNYYQQVELPYQKIVKAHDLITHNLFKKFYEALQEISSIGSIYESFINNFLTYNQIDINSLKYFSEDSFKTSYYWSNNLEISGTSLTYTDDWATSKSISFNNWELIDFTATGLLDTAFEYLPNKIYDINEFKFEVNYKTLTDQIENLENNIKLIENHPQISKSLLNQSESDFIIEKSFSTITNKDYLINTETTVDDEENPLYFNQNKINLKNNIVTSDNLLSDIHNTKPYQLDEYTEDVFPINFYDYALTTNNKIIFLPDNFSDKDNNYSLKFISSSSVLTYQEITFDYVIFSTDTNLSDLTTLAKNNLLILEDSNDNKLPYGKIYPDFSNPLKYYRVGKTSKNKKLNKHLILENNLIETYQRKDDLIYLENFTETTNIINPIYHTNKLNLEYYTDSFDISSGNLTSPTNLKINKYDFIYLLDNKTWYMFDDTTTLPSSLTLSSSKFYLFRFISNISKNVDLFDSSGYDFSNITLENLIILTEEHQILKVKNNLLVKDQNISEGYIIYDNTNNKIYQIINYSNNILETTPEIILSDNNDYRIYKNIYLDSGLTELDTKTLNLPTNSLSPIDTFTFEFLTSYNIYQIPQIYLPNPWEYRDIKKGDLVYHNNTLDLQTTTSSNKGWIYQSRDNWITFTNISGNWYSVNTQNLQIGDIIFNLTQLSTSAYKNDSDDYLHEGTVSATVLGRKGYKYLLSANITDNTYLVKSYPIKIKPTSKNLTNKLYQVNGDEIILEKIKLPSIKFNSIKFLVSITSNILTVNSGYNNNLKTSVTFDKTMIYPGQKILIDNKYWNSIKNYETMELTESIEDMTNKEMIIPETTKLTLLDYKNEILDKWEYLNGLIKNDKILCSIIISDIEFSLNNIVFSEILVVKENKRNIIKFTFKDKSFEDKFINILEKELNDMEYLNNIFINIENKFILYCNYDLSNNEIIGFKYINSDFSLVKYIESNNEHYYITSIIDPNTTYADTFKVNEVYILNEINENKLKKNNFEINLLNKVERLDNELYDFKIYKYEIFNTKLTFKIIKEYSYQNTYLNEFIPIEFSYNDVYSKNDKYLLELTTNPLDNLDDKRIYQINNELIEMELIENDDGIFIESNNVIKLNFPFYQKKNHLIYDLKENITLTQTVTPKYYEYFHYRIGFELISQDLIRVGDYLDLYDFTVNDNHLTKVIINENISHYFDNESLPILKYSNDVLTFTGIDSPPNKNTIILKIPNNDYDFTTKYKVGSESVQYYQGELLTEHIKSKVYYEPLIKNELDQQNNLIIEYAKENYLLVKLLSEIDWNKIVSLSNDNGINKANDIFYNNYTYLEDYNNYNEITLDEELKVNHNKIIDIVNEIYSRISTWIFIEDFKNNPDDFLNNFLKENYNLLYKNQTFYNLDETKYLSSKIPTYFKISEISSTLYLEYIIKKENISNDKNYHIFEELALQNTSSELALKLSDVVDFYSFWEKIKLGIPNNYKLDEIYLDKNVTQLKLDQIYRKRVLELYKENIYQGDVIMNLDTNKLEYITSNIFEYLIKLTSLKNNSDFYRIDFREKNLVLTDFNTEFITPKKNKARLKLNTFLLDQGIDLYGKINYSINNFKYLGNKFKLTLPTDSLPSVNFSIQINNDTFENIEKVDSTTLNISYNDMDQIDFINILVKASIKLKKGKYYLINSSLTSWIDNDTYLKIGNTLTKLTLVDNEIVSPKITSNNITLCKVVKITTKLNLGNYQYQIFLKDDFDYTPSYGYKVKAKDLSINKNICKTVNFGSNGSLYLSFDNELSLNDTSELIHAFKVNYQNKYKVEKSDLEKTIMEYGDDNNINLLNKFYLNLTDSNNKELGNYIYKVDLVSGSFSSETIPIYWISPSTNEIELLGNLLNGYLITIDKINDNTITVFELNNTNIIKLNNIQFIYQNYQKVTNLSLKFINILENHDEIDFTKFNLNLEEELVEEELNNSFITKCTNLLDNLKETKYYENYQDKIIEESPDFKTNFGYDILKTMLVKLHNTEIEKFDNKIFREYNYYFLKPERIKLLNKMLKDPKKLIIPLPFWFCRSWSNSLPIVIANESHFYIELNFNKLSNILNNKGIIINKPKITGKLVYQSIWLGEAERRLIGNKKHDYLIETFQKSQIENITKLNTSIDLKFIGAVKDFFFSFYLADNIKNYLEEIIISDEIYLKYFNGSTSYINNIKTLVDSDDFIASYQDILNRFTPFFKDKYFVGYLILHYLEINSNITKNNIIKSISYYWNKLYLKTLINKYYPLKNASLIINNYQHVTNKSDLFWSCKNQLNYQKSGDKGYYGYSYSLYPLERAPSGHFNHNLINSKLLIELNEEYLTKNKNKAINLNIFYRRYRLLRFMGNQAGVLW